MQAGMQRLINEHERQQIKLDWRDLWADVAATLMKCNEGLYPVKLMKCPCIWWQVDAQHCTYRSHISFKFTGNEAGCDMKNPDRLFEAFQPLQLQDDFEGTNISLANIQCIILRHGGRTWAAGSARRDVTFYFTLLKTTEL